MISACVDKNSVRRITAKQALDHPWFKKEQADSAVKVAIDSNVVGNLKNYKKTSRLRMAALNVLIHMLNPSDVEPLRKVFHSIDTDKSGFISVEELKEALTQSNHDISDSQVREMVSQIDEHKNGKINYSEFLAATVSLKKFMTEERLWMIFKHFDVDDSGHISKENMIEAFRKLGKTVSMEEIEHSLKEHDVANDGQISFDEFKIMF